MKTLRSKIFIFISLLLILPAIPLSYFTMQLLDKSYSIGVNDRVESALDGALNLSAEYYRLQKERLNSEIEEQTQKNEFSHDEIIKELKSEFKNIDVLISLKEHIQKDNQLVNPGLISKFLKENKQNIIWPSADRTVLFALSQIKKNSILQVRYNLPMVFKEGAPQIQEINQIYKTLGLVRGNIRNSFLYTFLLIYGIGLILALSISYFISKKITRPIEELKEATTKIGQGDLDYKIDVGGKDEFSGLANAFNNMTGELQTNQQQILQLEKMATWQQLARRLAHEIKNPLTPIQLMAQQMRDTYKGDDQAYKKMLDECSEIIEDEVGSLKNLVKEFSDFARLPEFNPEKQNIAALISTIKKLYLQANIETVLPDGPVELSFDYDHLKRVLINLVDNALAASGENSPVRIELAKKENGVEIFVSDQGEGISSENVKKIFEPYFSTKRSGVGLGLAIVKKIIEEHGGKISVESDLGEGTVFKISLFLE
ncbi:MAG: HAMP domain-containing protein [Calditrichaeota bacterium]|nr:MAG: HAMP domain-containing protein [Calditrichota bacterium]MBL1206117.1 HAMP domain-containing protein [Calditrichota bacterium]NOG45942.1 HAMP domain-containing protein [Calditrichota bacterium]